MVIAFSLLLVRGDATPNTLTPGFCNRCASMDVGWNPRHGCALRLCATGFFFDSLHCRCWTHVLGPCIDVDGVCYDILCMVVLKRRLVVVAGVGDHDLGRGRRLLMRWEVEELTEVKSVLDSVQNAVCRHLLVFLVHFFGPLMTHIVVEGRWVALTPGVELTGVRPSGRANSVKESVKTNNTTNTTPPTPPTPPTATPTDNETQRPRATQRQRTARILRPRATLNEVGLVLLRVMVLAHDIQCRWSTVLCCGVYVVC